MTNQMKFMVAGILFLLLVTALALMITGKTDSLSTVPVATGEKAADQLKTEPVRSPTQARDNSAPSKAGSETAVSQAQIDLMNKREAARIRRDEMMEVRSQTINELGPGNTGEPQR